MNVGAHQGEGELVTTDAPTDVAGTQLRLDSGREGDERLVADRMAPGVVNLLEAIKVKNDDCDRVILARRALKLGIEAVMEGSFVR